MAGQPQLDPVGAAVGIGQKGDRPADVAAGAPAEQHRLRAELRLDFAESFLYLVQGLVPAYPGEFALAPLSGPFQRMGYPIGMVDVLGQGQQSRAGPSVAEGVPLVAQD